MATNPMQRRARNSFLLGMLVMLLIAAIIIGGLVFLLVQEKKTSQAQNKKMASTYILSKDVKSGTEISATDVYTGEINASFIPSDAVTIRRLKFCCCKN